MYQTKKLLRLFVKKNLYKNFDERKVSENTCFSRTVKPSLSEKFNARERTSLSENSETVKTGNS